MRDELDEALCKDFPLLYRDRHASMQVTAMCWGFQHDDGWEPLIRKLSSQLTFLAKVEGVDVNVSTVKEKYGTLRFYTWGATDIMQACINSVERLSSSTCERCGEYGNVRSRRHWLACRCIACAYKEGYALTAWEAESLGVTDHIKSEDLK